MSKSKLKRKRKRDQEPGYGLAAWNTHNASKRRLRRYIKSRLKAGDVAIVLTEVWSCHPALRDIAREFNLRMLSEDPIPGGRQQRPIPEQGDTVMLLAPEFVVESWEVIVLDEDWMVFSAGNLHRPRRLIHVVGHIDGQRLELLGAHGPTGGNEIAVGEFMRKVESILEKTRDDTLAAVIGDINVRLPIAAVWAKKRGFDVSGHGPDLIITNGRSRSTKGRKRGSDHYDLQHRVSAR